MRLRRRSGLQEETLGAGVSLRGALWCGDGTDYADGRVVLDPAGVVVGLGPAAETPVPFGCLEVDRVWVGPGIVDAHVHLAFGSFADIVAGGVVAVRDLGGPPHDAISWRTSNVPRVEVAGPLLTAPGGYPSTSWGSNGFAAFVDDPVQATQLVRGLAGQVDVVKLALEPRAGPVPTVAVCAAVVDAAHAVQREVTCHALSVAMVERALDAGVDELAHTPTEPLPAELVTRIVTDGVRVVSTLHTFVKSGVGSAALANATALAAAGAVIRYGTDLGNAGIVPGADPRELDLLADAVGLGADAALRAATEPLALGAKVGVVVLDEDPRARPQAWRRPRAVAVGGTLLLRP
jgi:imidazolonepropionase-like amidohydrolase